MVPSTSSTPQSTPKKKPSEDAEGDANDSIEENELLKDTLFTTDVKRHRFHYSKKNGKICALYYSDVVELLEANWSWLGN